MLAFQKIGDGPAVIFIHGYPLRKEMWNKQIAPVVNEGFKVITVDLRGHGESINLGAPETLSQMGDDIIELMDNLGIEKAIIGGMSMGGYITFDLAARYPERFLGAFFIATKAAGDPSEAKENRKKLIELIKEQGPQAVVDAYLEKLFAPETFHLNPIIVLKTKEWILSTPIETLIGAQKAMMDRKDRRDIIQNLNFPTLFIAGAKDSLIPLEVMEEEFKWAKDGELKIVKTAGHMANMEEPREVADILVGWINRKWE